MLFHLLLSLPLPSREREHNHWHRGNDADARDDPSQYLNDLNLVALAYAILEVLDAIAFLVSPHLMDEDARYNPEDGGKEEEDGVEGGVKPLLRGLGDASRQRNMSVWFSLRMISRLTRSTRQLRRWS